MAQQPVTQLVAEPGGIPQAIPSKPFGEPRSISTRFVTNRGGQALLNKFQGVFESNTDIEGFDALSESFDRDKR